MDGQWERPKKGFDGRRVASERAPLRVTCDLEELKRDSSRLEPSILSCILNCNVSFKAFNSPQSHLYVYGLGSPSSSKESLAQLTFIRLALSRAAHTCVVEPRLNSVDETYIEGLGYQLIKDVPFIAESGTPSNVDASICFLPRTFNPIILFLPHCPKQLVGAVFARFANPQHAILIIANDLDEYLEVSDSALGRLRQKVNKTFETARLHISSDASPTITRALHSLKLYMFGV
eukprot:Blabericola_migrator_1__9731@NODE_532_length_7786_cov_102_495531_g405_i0_p7_GENE_NODE_532_length_7786_cov_102_495531_g405_i0NODE_532_length_7786_cov_102_495531_g405_i0_p7_ORF_typecomplete_len233_score35_35SRR1/PF07985_12/0_0037SRR1/PF07985_12/1e04HAUSaugmin3/PF14932_6/0_024DUF5546/PF17700_1/0_075DUF5546/PF17700_1/1e04Dpoe2NT/PF12213_8/0_19_NODE_532_length_7786_cov_102_495531_g405_i023523050